MKRKIVKKNLPNEEFKEILMKMFSEQVAKDFNIVFDYVLIFGTDELEEARRKNMSNHDMEKRLKEVCE